MNSLNLKKDSKFLINFLEKLDIDTNCDFLLITPFIQKYKIFIEKKYKNLLPNKITISEPIKRNFKNLIKNKSKLTKKKSRKLDVQNNKSIGVNNNSIDVNNKSKRINKLAVYLNNIDSCDSITGKANYRSNYIKILDMLYKKYPNILQSIYDKHNFSKNKIRETNNFLKKIFLTSEEDITDYLNYQGIELVRGVYIFLTRESLPDDIKEIVNLKSELYGEFTSLDIRNDIELRIPYTYIFKYKLGNINLNLEIHSKNKKFVPNNILLYRIFFLNYISHLNGDTRDIDLTLYLSNKKKHLPKLIKSKRAKSQKILTDTIPDDNKKIKKKRIIGAKEINSGCTTFLGTLPNKVSIWREEELGKVLLHELIHSLEYEKQHNQIFTDFIYKNFDIKRSNTVRLFEGYVETNANLINIILTILESKNIKNKNFKNQPNKLFLQLLNIEIKYSLFQVSKILKYYGYNNFNEFYKPNILEENKTDKYNQMTNVFSYVFFRSMIFFNLENFLKILFSQNNHSNILQEEIDEDKKIDFIKDTLQNSKYIETINKLFTITTKTKITKFVKNTTRLCAIESNLL